MASAEGPIAALTREFSERMAKFEAEYLNKTPNTAAPDGTPSLAPDYLEFKKFIFDTLECLQQQMETYGREIDAQEMRSRRKILLVHGVPEQVKEDTQLMVTEVIQNRLDLKTFTASSISRCHRVGSRARNSGHRPILLKVRDVNIRDTVWHSKTKLKGSGITLSEFLTKTRHQVFMAAREKFGVANCWTERGYIFVLGPNGKKHRIVSHRELSAIGEPASNSVPCPAPASERCPAPASSRSPAAVASKASSAGPRRARAAIRK
ncbi:uncharacterized protein LOC111362932 [Spodoptera litura]|uniref:Uncharacterized protein LOC111362932 n=1 Tax=Spodoptera litura TaxID=69820 RepID=A0A9J7EVA7_SPOLT|nr:uncharacterized protein LOC111362932 [Spodoptera litura]